MSESYSISNMKLQTRFLILMLAVFVAVGAFVAIQRYFDLERSQKILNSTLEEHKKAFDIAIESEGEIFNTFIHDYSFWDDMVDFIKTGNKQFAQNNLETGLDTYKADNIWIYNSSGKLVYSKNSGTDKAINAIPLPNNFFATVAQDKFVHFYLQLPEGTYEVRASTVVPGNDPEHNSAPAGYIVIGRFLGDSFVSRLQTLTQSDVKLEDATASTGSVAKGSTISFGVPLKNLQGDIVQTVNTSSQVGIVKQLNESYYQQLILVAVVGLAIIIIILLGIWLFVLRPINRISTAITLKDASLLNNMTKSRSQFGDLAKVVQEFFKQKLAIQEAETKRIELEKLNKEKSDFLSAAAHELKAPGTIISLVSESLSKETKAGESSKRLADEVNTITHQAKKMTALIGDLRNAAEGKESEQHTPHVFDFDEFIRREATELGYVIDQKIVVKSATKQKIEADDLRLSQVVSNLIRNAAKYSPKNKQITITGSVKDGNIVVEFADQGVGISEADQKHLFEKYFRSNSVKSKIEGLGLGLSICRQIITEMGGKIWVESRLGHGSQFYISLPLDKLKPGNKKTTGKSKIIMFDEADKS